MESTGNAILKRVRNNSIFWGIHIYFFFRLRRFGLVVGREPTNFSSHEWTVLQLPILLRYLFYSPYIVYVYFIRFQATTTRTRLQIQRILNVRYVVRRGEGYTEKPSKIAPARAHWQPTRASLSSSPTRPARSASPLRMIRHASLAPELDLLKRVTGTTITLKLSTYHF